MTTLPGAKTMTLDPRTRKIFLPVADIDMIPAADPAANPNAKFGRTHSPFLS